MWAYFAALIVLLRWPTETTVFALFLALWFFETGRELLRRRP